MIITKILCKKYNIHLRYMMSMLSGSFEEVSLLDEDETPPPTTTQCIGIWQKLVSWLFR
jgi:hypothetical protein